MEIVKHDININFIGRRKLAMVFSVLLIVAGIVSLIVKGGPDYGIDFAGGTLIQVKFTDATKAADIKKALKDMDLEGLLVQFRTRGAGPTDRQSSGKDLRRRQR
jgi:preprotein translocase subunit SecF